MQWVLWQERGLRATLVGIVGGGGYSHIDVIGPDGWLRGSRGDRIGHKEPGYCDRPPDYLDGLWVRRDTFTLDVSPVQQKRYWDFSRSCLGDDYDARGFFGFSGSRQWRTAGAWYSSEQVATAWEYSDITPAFFETAHRVDVGDCAFVLCALRAHIDSVSVLTENEP